MVLHLIGITLRPAQLSDLDALAAIWADPEVTRYLPTRSAPIPRERVEQALARYAREWRERGYSVWVIVDDATGQVAGYCGLRYIDDLGEVEVLYGLAKAYWGRGIATQAARAALTFGFDTLGLERIIALAVPGNIASRRVIEKAGLKYEKPVQAFGLDLLLFGLRARER